MARFMGDVQGSRGEASRLGTSTSGIRSHTRGWNVGVVVYGNVVDGKDVFDIYATGGSTDPGLRRAIGRVSLNDAGQPVLYAAEVTEND